MKILVINSGSSSIKSSLFQNGKTLEKIAESEIERIGSKKAKFTFKSDSKNIGQTYEIKTHEAGIKLLLDTLLKTKTIENKKNIVAIGHRVVHGGEKYTSPTKIDKKVLKELEKISDLAPLQNPVNIEGIKACQKILKGIKQITVFDTAFHQTMPEKAYLYGLPYKYYEKNKIRRYGFHGTSHKYIVLETIKLLKKKNAKIISCHMGNGISITASINGKSIDTSMGFTPLEGVMMGTRSGSIDPDIIIYLEKNLKMKADEITKMLNHKSGIKGISEISSDMRDVYAKSLKKDKRALLTIEMLSYQMAKYCGAYSAAMNGVDAITFTGKMGENAFYIREKICKYLEFIGTKLNKKKNENNEPKISDPKSKVKVFVIKTDEEKQIAEETKKLLKK